MAWNGVEYDHKGKQIPTIKLQKNMQILSICNCLNINALWIVYNNGAGIGAVNVC